MRFSYMLNICPISTFKPTTTNVPNGANLLTRFYAMRGLIVNALIRQNLEFGFDISNYCSLPEWLSQFAALFVF